MSAPHPSVEPFLWGAATAAHQVEGGNIANDWWQAEQAETLPYRSGEACDHFHCYEQDFALAAELGHNAHRLSVEWSRVEPSAGAFEEASLDHYERVVDALRRHGLEPVVTLHHFTNPLWFAQRDAWLAGDATELFARYVGRVVDRLGDRVRWWITVNEPTVIAKHAFVSGDWPPHRQGEWLASLRYVRGMCRAHKSAYREIHARSSNARVSFAHSAPWVEASRPRHPGDRAAAFMRDLGLNRLVFLFASERGQPLLDYVALNFYTRQVVRWQPRGRALLFGADWNEDPPGETRQWSDLGAEIHAPSLHATLRRYARVGLPLMITENGVATRDEALRLRHLEDHVAAVDRARREGIDVRGYLYWTLFDNFEWALGPTAKFGLCETDPDTLERRPRPAAHVYRELIRERVQGAANDAPGARTREDASVPETAAASAGRADTMRDNASARSHHAPTSSGAR